MAVRLPRHERPQPRFASATRWLLRGFLLVGIVVLAMVQGYASSQLLVLFLAVCWALLLPLLIGRVWRATAGMGRQRRWLITVVCGLFFLAVFAVVVGTALR